MREIILVNHGVTMVDDADYEMLSQWRWHQYTASKTYVCRSKSRKEPPGPHTIPMHRVIMNAPKGMDVDHIDGNGLNNQRANLRIATRGENLRNTRKRDNCTSQFKGVYWHARARKWLAQIKPPTGHVYLGLFVHEVEAAMAYDAKARELFGEFAKCNFEVAS